MTSQWHVQFGPNSAGLKIYIRSPANGENFDFIVEISGPCGSISGGTIDGSQNLVNFGVELARMHNSLTGIAILQTDYFSLTVSTSRTGPLMFSGCLTTHQFDQFPTGHIRVEFEQTFDPISIEDAIRNLPAPNVAGKGMC